MSGVIYYFSATGNSLQAAKIIAKKIDAEVVKITTKTSIKCNKDVVGFVYPTFYWGLPMLVARFAKKLKIEGNPYIFAVTTCGLSSGGALGQLNSILNKKGQQLSFGKTIRTVANNITKYRIKQKSISKLVQSENKKANEIAEAVAQKQKNNIPKVGMISKAFYKLYLKEYPNSDKGFYITSDCISCGTCQQVCPSGNIILKEGKPVFQHHCENCLACLHWCPKNAIEWKKTTIGKKRYHHPEILCNELKTKKE